jgi:ATP adenylyltransferase
MDHLWSPWRYTYVSQTAVAGGCIFCLAAAEEQRDEENFVVHRGTRNYILLNRYPYTNGHVLIAPYAHLATLEESPAETLSELILLTRAAEKHLRATYNAGGLNIGMNLGQCAGAGIAGHIHMHVLPRWPGDVSFMTSISETRVVPEDLQVTYEKLRRLEWQP